MEKEVGGDGCPGHKTQTEVINKVNRMKLELKKVDEGDTALVLVSITALIIAIFALVSGRI